MVEGTRPIRSAALQWWQAAAIFAVVNAISFLPAGLQGQEALHGSFLLPAMAPPGWLFAPVWLCLNLTSLVALRLVLEAQAPERLRTAFVVSEAIGWVLFATYTTVYFGWGSPVLGALNTLAGLLVACVSFACALPIRRAAAGLIGLRVLWLVLAAYVSVYVAGHNIDPFFLGIGSGEGIPSP